MQPISAKIKAFNEATAPKQNIEVWSTKHGASARDVKRSKDGQFVTNLSAKQLTKAF
jgi:hypothetical protein